MADGLCLNFVDQQLAVFYPISKRDIPAHPHPLLPRGCDLVPDSLSGYLTLELCKGQQHVEGKPAHGCGRIEGLGY